MAQLALTLNRYSAAAVNPAALVELWALELEASVPKQAHLSAPLTIIFVPVCFRTRGAGMDVSNAETAVSASETAFRCLKRPFRCQNGRFGGRNGRVSYFRTRQRRAKMHGDVDQVSPVCVDTIDLLINWSTSELNRQLNPTTCLGDTDCWIQQVTAPTLVVTCWIQQSTCILPPSWTGEAWPPCASRW